MKDTASAAVMGAIAGYLIFTETGIHRHWPEIEWILRILTG